MIRQIELTNIMYPVRVEHAHLHRGQRIDANDTRIDTLRISIKVDYKLIGPAGKDMTGVWNFGDLYKDLCESDVPTVTGPLENILDDVAEKARASVVSQNLQPIEIVVIAERLGLAVGWPKLQTRLCFDKQTPQKTSAPMDTRVAGIEMWPLNLSVDHSWCTGSQRVEHVDMRHENVLVTFGIESKKVAKDDTLNGLYNYAALIAMIKTFSGQVIKGPIEAFNDALMTAMLKDARGSGLVVLRAHVIVKRSAYARLTPSIGLFGDFTHLLSEDF